MAGFMEREEIQVLLADVLDQDVMVLLSECEAETYAQIH